MRKNKVDTKTESIERIKDANNKLKAENRSLIKEIKTLKRDNNRLRKEALRSDYIFEEASVNHDIDAIKDFLPLQVEESENNSLTCPACKGHNITELLAGIYVIEHCPDCGKRRKKKQTT